MMNKEQTPSLGSKPKEGFQLLHRPELLIAAAHGDSHEIKRLLLLLHREEDAAPQVVLNVEDTITDDVEKPPAAAVPPSEAVTGGGDSILHVVASSGDGDEFLECAKVIVGKANHLLSTPNRKRDTPLHCAARFGNSRMVSCLMDLARAGDGVRANERVKEILRMQNDKEETVLHEAVRLKDKDTIHKLLSTDSQLARVPLTDGASPLYLSLSLGHMDIAKLLFEKDKELSYSGPDGQNALHAAAIRWKWGKEATKKLLERNKDLIKQADRSTGSTPLHIAAKQGASMELLLEADPAATIYMLLENVGVWTDYARQENILPSEIEIQNKEQGLSQNIMDRTQIIGLGSVLVSTVTFAAAFAVPGGYRADGTPTLAGQYAFDAFVMANTLAFIFSGGSIVLLMVAGLRTEFVIRMRLNSLLGSELFLACSARCLVAAFAFGMYVVLAPVEPAKALLYCSFTGFALGVLESVWGLNGVISFYNDKLVLWNRL
ncbi:hypothetical protein D1007_09929 [Hordeum vulgare]|nr:hypothetical protein D1007_09929 [Hordeum vulgare]